MQSDSKQIFKITAERTGKAEDFYKDLGNFVFRELNSQLSHPRTLIVKLKGVGSWYLRRAKMKAYLLNNPVEEGKTQSDFKAKRKYEKYSESLRVHKIFTERLIEYDEYISLRNETRLKRHEGKVLLEPIKRKNKGSEPGQTNTP